MRSNFFAIRVVAGTAGTAGSATDGEFAVKSRTTAPRPLGACAQVPLAFVTCFLLLSSIGCFSERSFDLRNGDLRRVEPIDGGAPREISTRHWLAETHTRLASLLPRSGVTPLLTEQLTGSDGRAVDIFSHFGIREDQLRTLLGNFSGLLCTAQAVRSRTSSDEPAPDWPGFQTVWIPISEDLSLCGRLGMAHDGQQIRDSHCIVVVPGFLGDNSGARIRNAAEGLVRSGYHALAIELRGHGQTAKRYPQVNYNYGLREMADLLLVSEWLERQPHIRGTGLLGFCWGANLALLTAWLDGRGENDLSLSTLLAHYLPPRTQRRHFSAGVLAISPPLRWEDLIEELETPHRLWEDPVLTELQRVIRSRMIRNGDPSPTGSLRELIQSELAPTALGGIAGYHDGLQMLRLMDYRSELAEDKMGQVRVPVLIVQSADDPLSCAQAVADLISKTSNPNVAAIILPGGAHTGITAYARAYHYSLLANFFDPVTGASARALPTSPDGVLAKLRY